MKEQGKGRKDKYCRKVFIVMLIGRRESIINTVDMDGFIKVVMSHGRMKEHDKRVLYNMANARKLGIIIKMK
jgi:hypothetical protein